MASPTRPPPIHPPGHSWSTGHLARGLVSCARDARDPARSPWITPSTFWATACRNHPQRPLPLGRSAGAAPRFTGHTPERQSLRLPRASAGRHLCRPSTGSLLVQACGLASAPFRPLVAETPWASASELQRPKLRGDFHLLTGGAARRTTRNDPAVAGPSRPFGAARRAAWRISSRLQSHPQASRAHCVMGVATAPVTNVTSCSSC
jgi:hypothetical protein